MANSNADRIGGLVFVLALLFITFVAGAMAVFAKLPPSAYLEDAYRAGSALFEQKTAYDDPLETDFWAPAGSEHRGVVMHDRERVQPGYTLFTATDGSYARLITMDGTVVHEWQRPYSTAWNPESAVDDPQPGHMVFMREARVFPNGDLLALYIAAGDSPNGYGMVKLDSESNLIWSYLEHAHHDVDIGPDGRVYVLTNDFKSEPTDGLGFLDEPYVEEYAVILSPDGEELKKISLLQAMMRSKYDDLLTRGTAHHATGDPLHSNAIELITPETARNFPYGEAGDLLLSFRNISAIAVLDPETEEIVWATRGPWLEQHDPNLLPNGDIVLFDNYGNYEQGNLSRVLQFDPANGAITWSYHGTDEHPMSSRIRSTVQRLPNGNTLITESSSGRLLEVTPDGRITWEYYNRARAGNSDEYIPVISSGLRIDPADLTPEFRSTLESTR